MGSGSDFTAFQDFAGIPSLDLGFSAGSNDPVYHYHSNYDSFTWMDHYGDSQWHYHVTIAKIWALIAATLSETPIIALNATDYGEGLQIYLDSVKGKVNETSSSESSFSFHSLQNATTNLQKAAKSFDAYAFSLAQRIEEGVPWWRWWSRVRLYYEVRKVNEKTKLLERQFLYADGLDNRSWFKHVVFAPGRWTGYAGATYPGLVESFEDGNMHNARKWSRIVEECLHAAADLLKI
jgi:N-acetylated-alpha-linked acidic dipeptidase